MTIADQQRRWWLWPRTFEEFQLFALAIGIFWIVPRFYAALTSTSMGLMADAVQHVIEVIFSLFVYWSLKAAQNSNALLFPHGAGKFEAIANGLLAFAFLLTGFGIVVAGVMRLIEPAPMENTLNGIIVLGLGIVINTALYITSKPLEKSGREIIILWRKLYALDILMKAATIICVLLSELGGVFVYFDPIVAIFIGALMIRVALKSVHSSIWELSDRALEEEAQLAILRSLARRIDEYDELIDVKTRRSGGRAIIEVAVGFADQLTWRDIQDRCSRIRTDVEAEIKGAVVMIVPTNTSLFAPVAEIDDQADKTVLGF